MAWCPRIINKRGCKVTSVALVWNDIQHFLFYIDQNKHVCDSSKLILLPHISQEFLLLLRLGFAPWAVSPDIDLCKVFKRCQKKRVIKDYHLKLYLKNRGGNQATPIAIAFRSLLLHVTTATLDSFSKSLEISHEEDRDKRESTQSVYFPISLERGDVELSCGSLFQFKLIL